MKLSDWHDMLPDGSLPLTSDIQTIQVRHSIDWQIPLGGSLAEVERTGSFTYSLVSGEDILFTQTVSITYTLISEGEGFLGGGGFFIYVWYESNEAITTTVIDSHPTKNNPDPALAANGVDSWRYVWPGVGVSPFSEEGYSDPASGSDSTDSMAYVSSYWYGPTYQFQIPEGTKVVFGRDTLLSGIGIKRAEYSFRWEVANSFSTLVDAAGGLFIAKNDGAKLQLYHTYDGLDSLVARDYIGNASAPCLFKDPTNRLYLAASVNGGTWQLFESYDDGRRIKPAVYYAPDMTAQNVILWDNSFQNPYAACRADGTVVTVATQNNNIYYKTSTDNYQVSRLVAPVQGSNPYQILVRGSSSGHDELLITNAADHLLSSTDGGMTWQVVTV